MKSSVELETAKSFFQDLAKQRKTLKKKRFVAVWHNRKTGDVYKVTHTSYGQMMNYIKWLSDPEQRVKQAWNNYKSAQYTGLGQFHRGFTSHFPEDALIDIEFEIHTNVKVAESVKKAWKDSYVPDVRMRMPAPPAVVELVNDATMFKQASAELVQKARYDEAYALHA